MAGKDTSHSWINATKHLLVNCKRLSVQPIRFIILALSRNMSARAGAYISIRHQISFYSRLSDRPQFFPTDLEQLPI